jgi:hypothetical protein
LLTALTNDFDAFQQLRHADRSVAVRDAEELQSPKIRHRNRHFDRSCSQSHREQRSGEICFSTHTSSHTRCRAVAICRHPDQKFVEEKGAIPKNST